jgi:anti-sigma factor RsiW
MNADRPTSEADHSSDDQHELLVAYLDGELNPEQTADFELRLASDPALRRRLHELQRTWDVLDCLPQTNTDNTFTKSTIELVAREATREIRRQRRALPGTWFRGVAVAGLAAMALWGGFQVMRAYQTAPTLRLARDLRVIENMDFYRSIDSLDFLKQLEQAGVFVSEDPDHE